MICVAALIVFAFMAIFSAKYRPLAKEAFACVFLKIRLRPCQSGVERRVRMRIMLPFMKRTPRFSKFLYDNFSIFSTLFVLLTVASIGYTVYGAYNYALYGNCNGPGSSGFCIFDPDGPQTSEPDECSVVAKVPEALVYPSEENLSSMKTIHPDGNFTVIFFGCYSCKYTREAAPALFETMRKHPEVKFILVDFPIASHNNSAELATQGNCYYDISTDAYLAFAPGLYGLPSGSLSAEDEAAVQACIQTPHLRVAEGIALGRQTGVYGTPTYFIGEKPVVGPLNTRSLEKLIKTEMRKMR